MGKISEPVFYHNQHKLNDADPYPQDYREPRHLEGFDIGSILSAEEHEDVDKQ